MVSRRAQATKSSPGSSRPPGFSQRPTGGLRRLKSSACGSSPSRSTKTVPAPRRALTTPPSPRSEEHTSELQSRQYLVCRLLLEKKKQQKSYILDHSYAHKGLIEHNSILQHSKSVNNPGRLDTSLWTASVCTHLHNQLLLSSPTK